MSDPNEIRALKASLRGTLDTAGHLGGMQPKIEALDEHGDVPLEDLEELARLAGAQAVAAAALKGLVNTMQTRRSQAETLNAER